MKDDAGVAQLWTVSPNGGEPSQMTHNEWPIASTFTWSPNGQLIAHVMDNSVCVTEVGTGKTRRLTTRSEDAIAPRPGACVFSPDGKKITYHRIIGNGDDSFHQIFVVRVEN
jgi:tricorn protease-like protein